MVGLAPLFAAATVLAALFGFGGSSGLVSGIAQISFFVCLIALMVSLVMSSTRIGDQ